MLRAAFAYENVQLAIVRAVFRTLRASICTRAALQLEIFALRHQLHVLERARPRRILLTRSDRLMWAWLSRIWQGWRATLVIVKPETVLAWPVIDLQGCEPPWPATALRRESQLPKCPK